MFSIGKKKPVGIDIGSDSIKAVKLRGIKGSEVSVVTRYKIGCEKHGDELFDNLTQHGLKEIAKTKGFSQSPCTSIITDPSISFVNMKLPPMPKDDLMQAIKFEAKKELTYPISDAVVDYMIKNRESAEDPMLSIIAVAVKKDAVYKHIDFLEEAGFKPMAVEIRAIPLIAAFDYNYSWDASKKTALLDMGAEKSNLIIIKDKTLRFYRDIPISGNTFTNFFKEKYELSYSEADEKKINLLSGEESKDKPLSETFNDEILHSIFEQLALELQRSFDYYQAHYREGPVNELMLSGGGALINNIDSYLNEILCLDVTISNPFKKLYFANKSDEEEYSRIAPVFTTAVGLALRKG